MNIIFAVQMISKSPFTEEKFSETRKSRGIPRWWQGGGSRKHAS
jgi:hypothetical protein